MVMAEGKGTHTSEQERDPDKRPPWWKRLWARTGFGDKTLWEVLQLLIVPRALATIGFWFTAQQDARQSEIEDKRAQQAQRIEGERAKAERKLAKERAQDEALQAYQGLSRRTAPLSLRDRAERLFSKLFASWEQIWQRPWLAHQSRPKNLRRAWSYGLGRLANFVETRLAEVGIASMKFSEVVSVASRNRS
jgi:hypothetical protein